MFNPSLSGNVPQLKLCHYTVLKCIIRLHIWLITTSLCLKMHTPANNRSNIYDPPTTDMLAVDLLWCGANEAPCRDAQLQQCPPVETGCLHQGELYPKSSSPHRICRSAKNLYSCDKQNSALQSLPAPPRVKHIRPHGLGASNTTCFEPLRILLLCKHHKDYHQGQVLVVVHAVCVCEGASEKCVEAQEAEVRAAA